MMGFLIFWNTEMYNLNNYQRRKLIENPNIENLTESFAVYTARFKDKALKSYFRGESPKEIFLKAQIPIHYFDDPMYCNSYLKRRKKKY